MDWKKVVLVAIFSVLALELQAMGALVALSLVIYMLVKGMDQCRIANVGLLLNFVGVLIYPMSLMSQYGISILSSSGLLDAAAYLIMIGTILVIIGLIVTMVVKNKVKENIYEA